MYEAILIRYGEIALKGENRSFFESKLIDNIHTALTGCNSYRIEKTYGRIYIYPDNGPEAIENIMSKIKMIPGIVSLSPVVLSKLEFTEIKQTALEIFRREVTNYPTTFRVTTNRANKSFPRTSIETSRDVGAYILQNINKKEDRLSVDLEQHDHELNIEIRDNNAYIYTRTIPGPGGLPVGTSEKGLLLLSGGIDSPVAGWSAMRRGMKVDAVYFHSFPFTGDRAKEKVIKICRSLGNYSGGMKLFISYFTSIQKAIREKCAPRYYITIMRRMMYRLATEIAGQHGYPALITGENLGQVASQTLESLSVINAVTDLPVLRPLITRDKNEIIATAKYIDTYETSILPYEDCCTMMVPDNPVTRPKLNDSIVAEKELDIKGLIQEALEKTETMSFRE